MKKIFCALLAVMLLALLTACGCSTGANVEGEAGTKNRMYTDNIYGGNNNRTNDNTTMQGGASAEFDIYGNAGNNTNRTTGTTVNDYNRKTSSNDKGELSQLASLIGADDFKVIETLGEGDPDTVINGNIVNVKRRTYTLPVFGNKENVILSYGKDGFIENIEISPNYAPTIWSVNISGEYGAVEKVSSSGLDYDYYALWRADKEKVELICWNGKMSVQITKA